MVTTRVYVLPISGARFPIQIGFLTVLAQAYDVLRARQPAGVFHARSDVEVPDIVLCTSGGNVSAYLGVSSDWTRSRMLDFARLLSEDIFITRWHDFMPSLIFFPSTRAVYRKGYGLRDVFNSVFSAGQLRATKTEVWSGVYEIPTRRHRVVTNRARGATRIIPRVEELGTAAGAVPIYADGNIDVLADAALASASIPWVVAPVEINGIEYSDGGTLNASPLSVFENQVVAVAPLRMLYFSPVNVNVARNWTRPFMMDTMEDMVHGLRCADLHVFMNVVRRLGGAPHAPERHDGLTHVGVADILATLETNSSQSYAMILHPTRNIEGLTIGTTGSAQIITTIDIMETGNVSALIWRL